MTCFSRLWFQICFIFTPKIGEDSHFDEHIFRWVETQPPTSFLFQNMVFGGQHLPHHWVFIILESICRKTRTKHKTPHLSKLEVFPALTFEGIWSCKWSEILILIPNKWVTPGVISPYLWLELFHLIRNCFFVRFFFGSKKIIAGLTFQQKKS